MENYFSKIVQDGPVTGNKEYKDLSVIHQTEGLREFLFNF